jgi:hypothetical protein
MSSRKHLTERRSDLWEHFDNAVKSVPSSPSTDALRRKRGGLVL